MQAPSIHFDGSINDILGGVAVPAVLVEAWDAEEKFSEVLASAITDKAGKFSLTFDPALLKKAFKSRPAKVMLKVFVQGTRVAFTPSDKEIDLSKPPKSLALTIRVPQVYAGADFFNHLPADLRTELEDLQKHSAKVLKGLKDEKNKKAFIENPAQALAAMGISLSPQLRQRLMDDQPARTVTTQRAFRLLNGQIITPKVRINFTSGKE